MKPKNIQPIQVVQLASGDLWAGAEVQLFTLCKALSKIDGVTVKIILMNTGELEKRLIAESFEVAVFEESQLGGLEIFKRIKAQLKEWQPDILHTHRQKENIIGGLAAKSLGIPSVRTVHGASEHLFSWSKPQHKLISILEDFVGRFIQKKIIAVSLDLENKLTKTYPRPNMITIPNGVDTELLSPFRTENKVLFQHHTIKIGIVGRLVPVKRIDRFIDIAHILLKSNGELEQKLEFCVYGDGPLKSELQTLIDKSGISKNVILFGHTNNIYESIQGLDILLITSDHEGLPMTLLESMSIGTPVISGPIGGIPDVLDHGTCGTITKDLENSSFANAVIDCMKDKELTLKKINHAKNRINAHYSSDRNAQEYFNLYCSIRNPD